MKYKFSNLKLIMPLLIKQQIFYFIGTAGIGLISAWKGDVRGGLIFFLITFGAMQFVFLWLNWKLIMGVLKAEILD